MCVGWRWTGYDRYTLCTSDGWQEAHGTSSSPYALPPDTASSAPSPPCRCWAAGTAAAAWSPRPPGATRACPRCPSSPPRVRAWRLGFEVVKDGGEMGMEGKGSKRWNAHPPPTQPTHPKTLRASGARGVGDAQGPGVVADGPVRGRQGAALPDVRGSELQVRFSFRVIGLFGVGGLVW